MSDTKTPRRMGRPVRRSGEPATRERILDAAILLFSELGYERCPIKRIAEAVGLTESAIYRHFKGKEELLEEIIALTAKAVTQPLPGSGEGSPGASVFRKIFEAPAAAFAENPSALRMSRIFFMECPHNERIRAYLKYAMEEMADAELGRILEREIEAGRLIPFDARLVAHILNVIRYQWCYEKAILDKGEAYDAKEEALALEPLIVHFERLYSRI